VLFGLAVFDFSTKNRGFVTGAHKGGQEGETSFRVTWQGSGNSTETMANASLVARFIIDEAINTEP
jgi:hypothetical protein